VNHRTLKKADFPLVMEAARRKFGPGNPYGVQAFGIDRRVTRGRRLRSAALNVYVVHKHAAPERAVPEVTVRGGKLKVRPDVIGVGADPQGHEVSRIAPPLLGLYAGAAIQVGGRIPRFGGVACILGSGGSPTHFVTAGHLFAPKRARTPVLGGRRGERPRVVGTLQLNLLDLPLPGLAFPLDVALIELNADGARLVSLSQDGPRLRDVLGSDTVAGAEVNAFLPTAHDCSRMTEILDGPLDAQMRSVARGVYRVQQVLGTRAVITNPGDSGTVLYNGALNTASAVGLCVGQFGAMSIFEPLDRALLALEQATALPLELI
jgi:hypothetical protein